MTIDLIAFTGHREIPEDIATEKIDRLLQRLQPERAIVGGARGADTLAAELCLAFKIPYTMALPHVAYPRSYGLIGNPRWKQTFEHADEVIYVVKSGDWHFSHNFTRNIYMVDRCNLLVSISRFDPFGTVPKSGGTAHCVRYARKVRKAMEWVDIEGLAQQRLLVDS